MSSSKSPKDMERAQAAFHKKELQQRDGQVAMAEYKAAGDAARAKTEKLRALRLAKEEADRKAAVHTDDVEKALLRLQVDIAHDYIRREDWIRFGTSITAKIDGVRAIFDELPCRLPRLAGPLSDRPPCVATESP